MKSRPVSRRVPRPSPATVIATIALVVASAGIAQAGSSIVNSNHRSAASGTPFITGTNVLDNSLTGADVNESTLGPVPSATSATNAGTAGNANALGGVAAAGWVQNAGNIFIQAGHADWEPFSASDPVAVTHYTNAAGVARTATGGNYFRIDPAIPTSLFGKALAFVGLQICYQTNTGNSLTSVYIERNTEATTGLGAVIVLQQDTTVRTDGACRQYSPSSPVTLTSNDQISVYLGANWTTAGTTLYLGRVTAILRPTSTAATAAAVPRVKGTKTAPGAAP